MYTIPKRFAFSASHTIGGLPPEHPCARLHGHNYEVEVILQSAALDAVGFVRDYGELSALKGFLDTTVDHRHLNDVLGHDKTTVEVISRWLYDWCKSRWPECLRSALRRRPAPGRNSDRDGACAHQRDLWPDDSGRRSAHRPPHRIRAHRREAASRRRGFPNLTG
jgi:6-pyruvoyltetrahydropterin/6-carboxytetrahydropterin synthase